MTSNGLPSLPLAISVSPYAGRSYYTTRPLSAGTCVLDISTPFTCTLYKRFRNEVCAECWRYECGRRGFLTCREFAEEAGLSFCDQRCRDAWLEREGHEMIGLLKTLEAARSRRSKGKQKTANPNTPVELTREDIEHAWENIDRQQARPKTLRRWRDVQLDDFQADLARFVLVALCHYARELVDAGQTTADEVPSLPFGARWADFATLQSNETHEVTRFPELLDDHINIFQVLKARFGAHEGVSHRLQRLADVITIPNVRTALGVDPGNSFGIWEVPVMEESEGLGFGIYPTPSFFNHHCSPNVRKERDGRRLRFVTTRDVEPGEELCISYGNVENMMWQQRKKELKDGWFFYCRCSRCEADERADSSSSQS